MGPPSSYGGIYMKFSVFTAAAAASLLIPATAHANSVALEANGARAHEVWGGEIGVGYNLTKGPFTLRPMVGAFVYQGDNDRYSRQTFNNGNTVCRDSTNGQFAASERCDNTAAKAYGKVEATVTITAVAEIGGGARFSSDKVRPYGTAAFSLLPKLKLKANGGPEYYAVGLLANF